MAYTASDLNAKHLDTLKSRAGQVLHGQATTAISAANATDDATLSTLLADIDAKLTTHFASVLAASGVGAHLTADTRTTTSAQIGASPAPRVKLSHLVSVYHQHCGDTTCHPTRDDANLCTYTERNGSAAETYARANDLKSKANAHIASCLGAAIAT